MTADAFRAGLLRRRRPARRALPPTTGLSGTVSALATNLEAELARRGSGADNGGASQDRSESDRGVRVASRFLSEMSATFARNRPVLEALRERYRLGIVSNFYGNLEAVCRGPGLASLFAVLATATAWAPRSPTPRSSGRSRGARTRRRRRRVFIGDSLRRDCEGARRAGMRFIWIAPEDVQAAEAHRPQPSVLATVTDLPDLTQDPDMTDAWSRVQPAGRHHCRGTRHSVAGRRLSRQQADGAGRRTPPDRLRSRSLSGCRHPPD